MSPDNALQRDRVRWAVADHQASAFLSAVYGWMCFGLVVTAATAWFTASSLADKVALVTGLCTWGERSLSVIAGWAPNVVVN